MTPRHSLIEDLTPLTRRLRPLLIAHPGLLKRADFRAGARAASLLEMHGLLVPLLRAAVRLGVGRRGPGVGVRLLDVLHARGAHGHGGRVPRGGRVVQVQEGGDAEGGGCGDESTTSGEDRGVRGFGVLFGGAGVGGCVAGHVGCLSLV